METNREKFLKIATTNTELLKEIEYRHVNREWLRVSSRIAVLVLMALDDQKMSKKDLAVRMNVSPQYVSKIVKGQEKFNIETIIKLENALGISILDDTVKEKKQKASKVVLHGYLNNQQYAKGEFKYNYALSV